MNLSPAGLVQGDRVFQNNGTKPMPNDNAHDTRRARSRAWPQFPLKALFALVTVSAVAFALMMRPIERRRAVAAIIDAGGEVTVYDNTYQVTVRSSHGSTSSHGSSSVDDELAQVARRLRVLPSVRLHVGGDVTDAGMESLRGAKNVVFLLLDVPYLRDGRLDVLESLPALEDVCLWCMVPDAEVGPAALESIGRLQGLKTLGFVQCRAAGETLAGLGRMPSLRRLWLLRPETKQDQLRGIGDMPGLRELEIWEAHLSAAGVARLQSFDKLERLMLSRVSLGEGALDAIAALPHLTSLALYECGISDRDFDRLTRSTLACRLVELGLADVPLTNVNLDCLARLRNLKTIHLSSIAYGKDDFALVRTRFPNLVIGD